MNSPRSTWPYASGLMHLRRKRIDILLGLERPGALRRSVSESSTQSLLRARHVNAIHAEIEAVRLVAVVIGLVRAFDGNGQILGLLRGQLGELHAKFVEMQPRHLLVELFRQRIHAALV